MAPNYLSGDYLICVMRNELGCWAKEQILLRLSNSHVPRGWENDSTRGCQHCTNVRGRIIGWIGANEREWERKGGRGEVRERGTGRGRVTYWPEIDSIMTFHFRMQTYVNSSRSLRYTFDCIDFGVSWHEQERVRGRVGLSYQVIYVCDRTKQMHQLVHNAQTNTYSSKISHTVMCIFFWE